MSVKANKELIRKVFANLDEAGGDVAKLRSCAEEYVTPGYIFHHPSSGDMNIEQQIKMIASIASALSDLKGSVDDQVAEGDKVVTRYTMRGTHKGTFQSITATGKQIVFKGVLIDRIAGAKIVEEWDFPDTLGMMTQLGAILTPTKK